MIGDFNDEVNFPHELLLTDRQIFIIRKTLSHNSSADIKISNDTIRRIFT